MARVENEGVRSEALLGALAEALSGKPARLESWLAAHSSLPSPRPNLKLAAAFGAEVAARPGVLAPLLTRLGSDISSPDDPRAFLPVVAAHGWAGRIRENREVEPAWSGLAELAADERYPVRLGAVDALLTIGVRAGGADTLTARSIEWLQAEDRELRFGAVATMLEVLSDKAVLTTLHDHDALLEHVSTVLDEIENAPRSAERSEGRRHLLQSLPRCIAALVVATPGSRGVEWLQAQCARAQHPDNRRALSESIAALRQPLGNAVVESIRQALEASAKPVRDAARVRVKPGSGRGRRSRHTK
jgi:hypothetical protein